jgi:hypothetical protein
MELFRSHAASLRVIGVGLLLVGLQLLLYLLSLSEALLLKLVEDGARNKIAGGGRGRLTRNHGLTLRRLCGASGRRINAEAGAIQLWFLSTRGCGS